MRILSRKTLREFWDRPQFADSRGPLQAWFREVKKADWSKPSDVKDDFRSACIVGDSRAVFNIAGNKCRIIVRINYPYRVVYIRFAGTHKEYDRIDVNEV